MSSHEQDPSISGYELDTTISEHDLNNSSSKAVVSSNARQNKRVILNAETAFEIYKLKIQIMSKSSSFSIAMMSRAAKIRGKSKPIAQKYHVSTKTIRDIWNRKTWVEATRSLWQKDLDDLFSTRRTKDGQVCKC